MIMTHNKPSYTDHRASYLFPDFFSHPFLMYTLLFAVLALVVFYPFYSCGQTFVWEADGATQYILRLEYTGSWIRQVLSSFIHGHPSTPFYDFVLGTGDDIFLMVKQYPVLFFGSVFANHHNSAIVYTVLTMVHIYLMGLCFVLFAREYKLPSMGAVCGALIYALSGFTFYHVLRHPQFASGAIYLPLLLTGFSKAVKGKGKCGRFLFPLITALSLSSGFYFHYMNSVVLTLYGIILLFIHRKDRFMLKRLFHAVFQYIIGCGMACFSFLPMISVFFQSGRNVLSSSSSFRHTLRGLLHLKKIISIQQLIDMPASLVAPVDPSISGVTVFVPVLIIPCLIALFRQKLDADADPNRKPLVLRIGFVLILLALCMPLLSHMLTGADSAFIRWSYIAVFVFACITGKCLKYLTSFKKTDLLICAVFAALYIYLYYTLYIYEDVYLISFSLLLAVLVCAAVLSIRKSTAIWVFFLFAVINIALNGYQYNSNQNDYMASPFLTVQEVRDYYKDSPFQAAAKIKDPDFYRVDVSCLPPYQLNGSVPTNTRGIAIYNSYINKEFITLLKNTENTGLTSPTSITGLGQSSALEQLLAVKYVISDQENATIIPSGFEEDKDLENQIRTADLIFKNKYPVGLACSYKEAMSEADYDRLNALEKQESLLQYAVIPEKDYPAHVSGKASVSAGDLLCRPIQEPLQITKIDPLVTKKGNVYTTNSDDYDDPYLLWYEVEDISELNGIHFKTRADAPGDFYLRISGLTVHDQLASSVNLDTEKFHTDISRHGDNSTYNLDANDYTVYMGHYDDPEEIEGVISFIADDSYTIDTIEAFLIPSEEHQALINSRSQNLIKDVKLSANTVSCTVPDQGNRYMVFSIPWKKGWKAYVDGSEAPVYRSNDCFIGLDMQALNRTDGQEKTEHTIKLRYRPYGLNMGIMLSIISLGLLMIYGLVLCKPHKPRKACNY